MANLIADKNTGSILVAKPDGFPIGSMEKRFFKVKKHSDPRIIKPKSDPYPTKKIDLADSGDTAVLKDKTKAEKDRDDAIKAAEEKIRSDNDAVIAKVKAKKTKVKSEKDKK